MKSPLARHLVLLSLAVFALTGCTDKKSLAKIQDLQAQIETMQEENTTAMNDLHRQLADSEEAARTAQADTAQKIQQLTAERDTAIQQLATAKTEMARAEAERIAKVPTDPSAPGHPDFDPAKETKYTNALATITGDKTSGSGFVAVSGGKLYLYTAASVIAGNSRFSISNAAGTKFTKFGNLEVAEKTSFVRLELLESAATVPALHLADEDSRVAGDTQVCCLATESGSGSIVSERGVSQGQTDDGISIDPALLQGKTGGPLLESATGKVLAIVINPATEPQHQLWSEPAGSGQPGEAPPLRANRLNRRVLWKATPIGAFLADAKKIAEYNRLTGVAQALSVLNTSPGLGLTTTISGSFTAQSILAAAKDLPIAAEVINLRDDIASKHVRIGEADLKKRIASLMSSAMTQMQRPEAELVPAKLDAYHRPYAEESLTWRKDAMIRLKSAGSSEAEPATPPTKPTPPRNSGRTR